MRSAATAYPYEHALISRRAIWSREWVIHLMPWPTTIRSFGCMDVAILAGVMSTGLFAMSYLPMLVKAARTRDLSSYSLGNLAITNAGNLVHSLYVFSLPVGPIWFLHAFYLIASALMLVWFLRYRAARPQRDSRPMHPEPAR